MGDYSQAAMERHARPGMFKAYSYLASPYTHVDARVMEQRYQKAMAATHWLLIRRIWVYSPIVHCHELAKAFKLPRDSGFWRDYNQVMLGAAKELLILALEGWEDSDGIKLEAAWAHDLGTPIKFIKYFATLNEDHFVCTP